MSASFRSPAFKCNYPGCEEVFLRLADFAVHYVAHAGVELIIPDCAAEKKTLSVKCPLCPTVVPGLYKLMRHKMKHDSELKYKCPACPKQFVKANTLRMHINNVHKNNKNNKQCKLCNTVLTSDQALINHLECEHQSQRSVCAECGEIFSSDAEVTTHKNSSHNTCVKCKTQVPRKSQTEASGQSSSIKTEHVSCPECEESLEQGTSLSDHFSQSHPGQQQRFQCSDCDSRFISLLGARRHHHQHHKSSICQVCKETLNTEADLITHLCKVHQDVVGGEDEKGRLKCPHCPEEFQHHTDRVQHVRFKHLVESIDISTTDLEEVRDHV